MTLVVEDGTGLDNAESYVSVADCDSYHEKRGNTEWLNLATSPTSIKENILRKATDYIDGHYVERWKGETTYIGIQALAWPRDGVIIDNGSTVLLKDKLPVSLVRATCEVALLIAKGEDLAPSLERGGRIKALTQVVGPLSERTAWADDAPVLTVYPNVERYIKPLLATSAIMGTVTRG